MRNTTNFFKRLLSDENGGEVLEYALIAGLIVVASAAAIATLGGKITAMYDSTSSAL